jgi:catechol 2,3-dioxygenase-like lactoylglutathione lyase family enzyme
MITGIQHIGIVVSDINRSVDFYKNVLGLEVGERWEFEPGATLGSSMRLPRRVVFIKAKNASFELLDQAENTKTKPEGAGVNTIGLHHIAFNVEKIHDFAANLAKKGIRFSTGPADLKDITVAFFEDPDGNMLELYERKKQSSNSKQR